MRPGCALLVGLVLAGCSSGGWRELRPEGWEVRVRLPCKPGQQVRAVPQPAASASSAASAPGATLQWTVWSCEADGVRYALASGMAPQPEAVGPMLAMLGRAAPGVVIDRDEPAAVPGMTPSPQARRQAWHAAAPDGAVVEGQRVQFVRGLRLFQAQVIGPGSRAAAGQPFFDSLAAGAQLP